MNVFELKQALDSGRAPILLHVLPEEVFEALHIRGSRNACVYAIAFQDYVTDMLPDKNAAVVVYGAGRGSLDSVVAAEKMREAGFSNVEVLDGGLDAWIGEGFPFVENGRPPGPADLDGTYRIDIGESLIRWTGRNLFSQHYGTLRLASGEIRFRDGELESAGFSIDMNSIACDDLTDSAANSMLLDHLKTGDFFEVDRFPTARFDVDSARLIESSTEGTPDYQIEGRATLRGITRPLAFPIVFADKDDGRRITAQAQFEVDRTEFGSIYGSGRFFRFLGKHLVNDHFHLHVMIHAERARS
jgi:polyisoprenoid-binding protein YceI